MNNDLLLTINKPAETSFQMGQGIPGSYDGRILKPGGDSNLSHHPNDNSLSSDSKFIVQGHQIPLLSETQPALLPNDSMFYFSNNMVSMECCPSTYTTDKGCVCTTEQQRKFIGEQRGNNKNSPEYPTI